MGLKERFYVVLYEKQTCFSFEESNFYMINNQDSKLIPIQLIGIFYNYYDAKMTYDEHMEIISEFNGESAYQIKIIKADESNYYSPLEDEDIKSFYYIINN